VRGITTHRLDVLDEDQLRDMIVGTDEPLDRIIANAGIKGAPRPDLMEVNAEAPMGVVESLLDAGCLARAGPSPS
jgi:hypothetical protein